MKTMRTPFNNVQKIVVSMLFFIMTTSIIHAQDPNWQVNSNDYEYNMTFLSFLTIDGTRLASENDKVAVFVDGVCRGTTNLTYVASQDAYYAFLTAFSNNAGELLTVKVYDSTNNQVRDINTTIPFSINSHTGTLFQALSWADPALNADAEILDFGFEGIIALQTTFENRNINIILDDTVDVTSLTPVYQLSDNSGLFINTVAQTSGVDVLNFSSTVNYQVRSQDQSTLNEWTVTVEQISNEIIYRKRDAVCYQAGAIKVTNNQEGVSVLLSQNGNQIDSKPITNGEVLFEGLEAGAYNVQLGALNKEININLRVN